MLARKTGLGLALLVIVFLVIMELLRFWVTNNIFSFLHHGRWGVRAAYDAYAGRGKASLSSRARACSPRAGGSRYRGVG